MLQAAPCSSPESGYAQRDQLANMHADFIVYLQMQSARRWWSEQKQDVEEWVVVQARCSALQTWPDKPAERRRGFAETVLHRWV